MARGRYCNGQVLVSYDLLGLFDAFVPPFVKRYAHLADEIVEAAQTYAQEVRHGVFPKPATERVDTSTGRNEMLTVEHVGISNMLRVDDMASVTPPKVS